MKTRTILTAVLIAATTVVAAQRRTTMATLYRDFRPSTIHLADGRSISQPLTNIFLKNSTLLYLQGTYTMEASMDNIVGVDFDDRKYIKIANQLAWLVDSVGPNRLYCIELADLVSYEQNLRNNVNYSNIEIGEHVNTATIDFNNEDDRKLPVFRHFYYLYQGEFVKVHERELLRRIPKERRRMFKTIVGEPTFTWTDADSLLKLLKTISD